MAQCVKKAFFYCVGNSEAHAWKVLCQK